MSQGIAVHGTVNAREPEVLGQIRQLEQSLAELNDLTCNLEERLSPVLVPADKSNECATKAAGSAVPLADSIHRLNNGVRGEIDRLFSLLQRLEI